MLEREEPVFDGTASKLREICKTFCVSSNYLEQRKRLKDGYPKELTLNKLYIEKLAEGLDD